MSAADEMFAEIERIVRTGTKEVEVTFKTTDLHGADAWKVSFNARYKGAKSGTGMMTGGGKTLQEAFENAFIRAAINRLDQS